MSTIKIKKSLSIEEAFNNFIFYKTTQGVSEGTISNYKGTLLNCVAKYLDISIQLSDLNYKTIQTMIVKLREADLSTNTIASYIRILRVFLSWARSEGLCDLSIPSYKTIETVKEVYTDRELSLLLKKPNLKKCRFPEYRSWVIINFLVNSGARASTIRNILISDVDLDNGFVNYRHTKNRKVQVIPLCTQMRIILKEYLNYRKGSPSDYLFCTESGEMLTENALRSSIIRYNTSRGVEKNSIHLFRHTVAKKYLLDCGGNPFTLQRILGHSTLDMTLHYCNIYNVDLISNYDSFSPLQKLTSKASRLSMK